MIIGWGLNTTATLDPSPEAEACVPSPRDLSLALGLVDDIVWTSWAATVGRVSANDSYLLWGFYPSPLHPGRTPPTELNFPSSLKPKRFIGTESLEAALGEDGVLYLPRDTGQVGKDWQPAQLEQETTEEDRIVSSSSTSRRVVPLFRDVAVIGTGQWYAILESPPSSIVTASSLADLLVASVDSNPSSGSPPPSFDRIIPSTSHCFFLPSPFPRLTSPLYGLGSNLHSQLSTPLSHLTLTSQISPIPLLLPLLECGSVSFPSTNAFSTSGVYSSAVSETGDLYLWGGRWGPAEDPEPPFPEVKGEEEDGSEVMMATVGATGGCVAVTRDGRVFGRGVGADGCMPKLRIEEGEKREIEEWVEMDLSEFGVGSGGKRRVRKVVSACGGRGWFVMTD